MNNRLEKLQQMLAKSPRDPFLLYGIGMEHKSKGDLNQAISFFEQTITADAGYCYAYYQRGLSLQQAGDKAKAKQSFLDGISAANRKGDAHAASELNEALAQLESEG